MAKLAKSDEKNFADLLQSHSHQISKALGSVTGGALDKFLMSTMNLVRQNPGLLECDQFSMLNAIRESATLGLSLDPNMGEASIVPFKKVAKLIPGYRGLIKLATRSGHVSHMQARIFYRGEYDSGNFIYEEGTAASIHHLPLPPSERGDPMGAYSVAALVDGGTSFDLMWKEDVDQIEKRAPGAKSADSAWKSDWAEMWRKSVVRRHIKYLNISNEMGEAVGTAVKDEYFDAGIVPDVPLTAPKPTKAIEEGEKVAEASDAPVPEKRGAGKGGKQQKPKEGKPPSGNDIGTVRGNEGQVDEEPHDSAAGGSGEDGQQGELGQMDGEATKVKVNIRELAESLELDASVWMVKVKKCANNMEQLNEYRLQLVKQLNEKMNA